jgi:hypothetical protein
VAQKVLYRNNLKNRDFGQEAPHRFDPERATIAREARRERGAERSGKLTPPKTDSSGCFGIYRNNLKNRDFGQEAPHRFDPERATIAREARRERGAERSGKLTPPKTDSSGCFGINID